MYPILSSVLDAELEIVGDCTNEMRLARTSDAKADESGPGVPPLLFPTLIASRNAVLSIPMLCARTASRSLVAFGVSCEQGSS